MKNILTALKGDLTEYTSIPFWSWNNELEPRELIRQISEFKAAGIDGFIMHARTGLKTGYLGEKWWECVGVCLKEARRLNMQAWVYDENGWPSGFVEGRLLEDEENLVQYLEYENGQVRIKNHSSYADILNEKVVGKFIEATHEEYYKRFKDSFGRELAGFFTDEPQYFRYDTAYSRVLPREFKKEYGLDIAAGLPYLFQKGSKAEEFRYKYHSLMNKLYTEKFYKRIYDWCEAHNCKLTGHAVEETRLFGQMWCCAGAMPSYEYEHIPGIDWLARVIDCAISPKQAGSVSRQLGKRRVLTETFGCSGWDTTPRELRWIAEFQYVNGVNSMCQHLFPYSLKGQAKGDHPPFFSRHNLWIRDSKPFNDYFKRLSYILCNTGEAADALVVHPMRSAYLTYDRKRDYESIKQLEDDFVALTKTLTERGVQFHYGDETIMTRHARVSGKQIVIGECAYDSVVLPSMDNIGGPALKLLKEFVKAGGRLAFYGKTPVKIDGTDAVLDLKPNISFDDVRGLIARGGVSGQPLMICRRKGEAGEFIYVFNSDKEKAAAVKPSCRCKILDLINVEIKHGGGILTVQPMESVMLMPQGECRLTLSAAPETAQTDITDKFKLAGASENTLTVDFVSVSKDGKTYSAPEYVHSANERLIKESCRGKLWLKYVFDVKDKPAQAKLLIEQMEYTRLELNGKELKAKQSDWDILFSECDIAPFVKTGANEFIAVIDYFQRPSVKHVLYDEGVMESLKNCVVIDTEIDAVYVKGNFAADENRAITKRGEVKGTNNLQLQGYPNFAGDITFRGEINVENTNAALKLTGRYMSAAVKVNGKDAGLAALSNGMDLSKLLQKGKNVLEITITSSMRNMLGPHHLARDPEPTGVGHYAFDFRGTWKDGKAPDFTEKYNLVNFGLEKISLINL